MIIQTAVRRPVAILMFFAGLVLIGGAETILLVGSEGGSTWGFAATLHAALV